LIRRIQSWPLTNIVSGQTCNYLLTSITGTFAQCVVWYSTAGPVNTAVDVYPNIFQNIWLADSGGVNVLGSIQWTTNDLRYFGSKAYGGNYFIENLNTGVFPLTYMCTDNALDNLQNNGHSSGYVLSADNVHQIYFIANQAVSSGSLNALFWMYGTIEVDVVSGDINEKQS